MRGFYPVYVYKKVFNLLLHIFVFFGEKMNVPETGKKIFKKFANQPYWPLQTRGRQEFGNQYVSLPVGFFKQTLVVFSGLGSS